LRVVNGMTIKAILCDIEGTTSSIAFVKQTLFPYARERMEGFVKERAGDAAVAKLLADARELPASLSSTRPEPPRC
jgi:enolase-phosphatase E1